MTKHQVEAAEERHVADSHPAYVVKACHESVIAADAITRKRALDQAASTVGEQRAKFVTAMAKLEADEKAPIVTVKYGKTHVSVTKDRDAVVEPSNPSRLAVHPAGAHPVVSTSLLGAAPGNKAINGVVIPCGVCLIVGAGGSGKTPLAHALAGFGVESYSTVRVGEPLAGYSASDESVAYSIACAMINNSDVVLDSIKDLLASSGAAMKSGLSRDALASISGWAALACELGCTIYVPVNPSTPDPEVLELLAEAARSNATMTIVSSGAQWKYSARRGEGLKRTAGDLSLSFNGDAVSVKFKNPVATADAEEIVRSFASSVSHNAWSQATRRAASQSNSD